MLGVDGVRGDCRAMDYSFLASESPYDSFTLWDIPGRYYRNVVSIEAQAGDLDCSIRAGGVRIGRTTPQAGSYRMSSQWMVSEKLGEKVLHLALHSHGGVNHMANALTVQLHPYRALRALHDWELLFVIRLYFVVSSQ